MDTRRLCQQWCALVTCALSLVHRVGDPRVFLAAAERHTLTMRYGHGRETASGPIGRRSPDQPVAAALSPGLRRTQKVNIMMDLRAARARPAEGIARAILAGRGTRRCRWRQIARHRARHGGRHTERVTGERATLRIEFPRWPLRLFYRYSSSVHRISCWLVTR